MGIICERCGRDIDALGQDNMGMCWPLCEDCWNGQKSLAVQDRSLQNLHRENERLRSENKALADNLAEAGRKLADARQRLRSDGPADCKRLRREVETAYEASRERALALTKLDECEMWLGRCEPKETAAPTLKGAAQEAAMPCLKDDEVRGFAMPDVNVEVKAEVTAEKLAKSLRESMQPAMRMEMGGGRSMTNWEHFFGTPEKAALMDVEFYAIPAMVVVKREEQAGDTATLRVVARFYSNADYLAWLKAERCGE